MQTIAYPKEQLHRISFTKLTEAQIASKLGPTPAPKSASPLSTALAGKSLRIVTDNGPSLRYRFTGNNRLSLVENDGRAVEADYGALTLDHVTLFSHLLQGTQRGYHVVVDHASGLATVFEVWFSGFTDNREVQREIYFGYVEEAGKEAPKARHSLTNRVEGKGFHHAVGGLELGRINVAARGVGVANAALKEAVAYSQVRKSFGKPICEHQAIQLKLGEMATRVEAARLLVKNAAEIYDRGERCDLEAGMAKLFATESAQEIALEALRIHGGAGYSKDFDVERYYRDAPLLVIGGGTNELQRLIIARALVAKYPAK